MNEMEDRIIDALRITSLSGAMLAWVHENRFDEFVKELTGEVDGYDINQIHEDMHAAIDIVAGSLDELKMRFIADGLGAS